jgi:hypothetical protein
MNGRQRTGCFDPEKRARLTGIEPARPACKTHRFCPLAAAELPTSRPYEGLDLPADPGWHLFTFTATSGSPSDDRLRLLASWAATLERQNTASRSAHADASDRA